MKISFCISCMGRLFQLERTLPQNLCRTSGCDDVEFVILNYNSPDNLHDWMQSRMISYLRSGRIRYGFNPEPSCFHSSKAKNQAHRLATGDILVNLDADNLIGDSCRLIRETFSQSIATCLHMYSGCVADGTYGRIAIHRTYFEILGGYDESFYPMGGQDVDLIQRAKMYGLRMVWIRDGRIGRALRNSRALKMKLTGFSGNDFRFQNQANLRKMHQNLRKKILVANKGKFWGEAPKLLTWKEANGPPPDHSPLKTR